MKKWFLLFVLIAIFQIRADAFVDINEDYTGNGAYFPSDFPSSGSYIPIGQGLGGTVFNGAILRKGRQFTVSENSIANYLSVSGILRINQFNYESSLSNYHAELSAQGYTVDEIIKMSESFVGPAQSFDVEFSIIEGSVPYRPSITPRYIPMPSSNVISSAKYKFLTDNSKYDKEFSDLLIPFSPFDTHLEPNQDYWIMASNQQPNGMIFSYGTKLEGSVTTPEPATMLLMGGGLVGILWRRRKLVKI